MNFWQLLDKQLERVEFKHIIALITIVFTFWIFKLVLFESLPESADKYASQIVTGLIGVLTLVLSYWFVASSLKKGDKLSDVPDGMTIKENTIRSTTLTNDTPASAT